MRRREHSDGSVGDVGKLPSDLAIRPDQAYSPDGHGAFDEFELSAAPELGFRRLVWSDYEVLLAHRSESVLRSKLLYLPRMLLNPSLQFALTVRIAQKGPRPLLNLVRLIQVWLFSSEVHSFGFEDGIELGPGVAFPHPFNILIGGGPKIGAGVTIYNNTQIGGNRHVPSGGHVQPGTACRLGDRSVVYSYAAIQGPYDIGHDAVIGIQVLLESHVPPGALQTFRGIRLAGQWPGEGRAQWDNSRLVATVVQRRD